mgnify:CR=1 FL=1
MTIIKKFEKEQQRVIPQKFIFISFLILLPLILLQIWAYNTLGSFGEKLSQITSLQNNLNLENQIIENEIAKTSSLQNLASQSAQLGLSSPKEVKYLH